MKRKFESEIDNISIKAEMKKRARSNNKKCRMEKTLIRHGAWFSTY